MKRVNYFFLIVFLSIVWWNPAHSQENLDLLLLQAEQGDAKAQCEYGMNFFTWGASQEDYKKAVSWFRKAAEKGYVDAQYFLGIAYERGLGVSRDYEEAASWLRKAAEQGNDMAQYHLGDLYLTGKGVQKNYEEAFSWYLKSSKSAWPTDSANYRLGVCYYYGYGVTKDLTKAVELFRLVPDKWIGGVNSGELLSRPFKEVSLTEWQKRSLCWLKKMAAQGNANAQYNLGLYYEGQVGEISEKNSQANLDYWKRAVAWFTKSTAQGNARAQYRLGLWYYEGHSHATYTRAFKDLSKACYWFKKAIEQRNRDAMEHLYDDGFSHKLSKTVYKLKVAAEQGNSNAQYDLGLCYLFGDGADNNLFKAAYWLTEADENKNESAGEALMAVRGLVVLYILSSFDPTIERILIIR